jgi:hypothetical protein
MYNQPLSETSEEDLRELRAYLKQAPTDRAILTCIICLVITVAVAVITGLCAVASWMSA